MKQKNISAKILQSRVLFRSSEVSDEYGNVSEIREFNEGLPDGILLQFASNGALNSEENYSRGKLEGRKTVYRFGGIKKLVENYTDGKLNGIGRTGSEGDGHEKEKGAERAHGNL